MQAQPHFSQCHFCIYQSAIGDKLEREKLVFVYNVYFHLRGLYTLLVYGGGDFFSVSLNRKKSADGIFLLNSMFT